MATDPKTKPVRWEFDLHELVFEARSHPLPVPIPGIFDETVHCAMINVQWLPHIIGALQILVEGDSWAGGDEEIFRAQQEVQKLISVLSQPCTEEGEMLIPEFRTITIDDLCDQNQWKYTIEPDTAWRNLGTTICDGEDGTDGIGIPGEDGENGRTPEFQITPSGDCQIIQWRYVGDTEWIDLATVCNGTNGLDGIDGINGADGREPEIRTINEGSNCFQVQWRYVGDTEWINAGGLVCCECDETVPPNPVEPEEENGLYCSIAINMAADLHRIHDKAYEDEGGALELYLGGGTTIAGLFALFWTGIGAAVAVVTAGVAAILAIRQIFENGESNAFDLTAEEAFRCMLYCILIDLDSPEITSGIIEEWALAVEGYTIMGEQRFAVAQLIRATPLEQWQWVAYASSEVNPAACDCGCAWCFGHSEINGLDNFNDNWTASDNNPGNVPNVATAVFANGVGWNSVRFNQANNASDPESHCRIKMTLPTPATLTRIRFQFTSNSGYPNQFIKINGTIVTSVAVSGGREWTGSQLVTDIELGVIKNDPGRNSTATITSTLLEGVGDNPFGAGNCT